MRSKPAYYKKRSTPKADRLTVTGRSEPAPPMVDAVRSLGHPARGRTGRGKTRG